MTTISAIKGKDFIIIGADTQVSNGNLRLPFPYRKISRVGSNLIAGSGSVGNLQRVLNICLTNLRINKVYAGNLDLIPDLDELCKSLAELNFSLPLEHKHYNPFSFLIGGLDSETNPALVSIGSDGSIIEIPTFYCDGSGSDYALSILNSKYNSNLTMEEAGNLVFESLKNSSQLDIYTNDKPEVVALYVQGEKWEIKEMTYIK